MMESFFAEPVRGRAEAWEKELEPLDDRSLAIVVGASVENDLKRVLQLVFGGDRLLHGYTAPLGTFGAAIEVAAALGVIEPNLRSILDNIRKARNEAAHVEEYFSLDDHQDRFREVVRTAGNGNFIVRLDAELRRDPAVGLGSRVSYDLPTADSIEDLPPDASGRILLTRSAFLAHWVLLYLETEWTRHGPISHIRDGDENKRLLGFSFFSAQSHLPRE